MFHFALSPIRRRLSLAALTATSACALSTAAALAQTTALPGIVVQGTTIAAPPVAPGPAVPASRPVAPAALEPEAGGIPIDRTGTAVNVITGEELRRTQVRTVGEALRGAPGISVSRTGGASGLTVVRMRGGEANHTLVLIDGVQANDATTGAFDFSDLSTDNIERIEIIRGPQSGLYGSNALSGVINVMTRGGRGPLELQVRAEVGSFDTGDAAVRVSGGNERAWGSVSYHVRDSNGFDISPIGRERDGSRLATFAARGGVRIFDGVTLDFSLRKTDKYGERDTEGGPVGTLAVQVDDNASFTNQTWLGAANLRWDMLDGHLTHILRVTRNETRTVDTSTTFMSNNISEAVKTGYLTTYRFETPALLNSTHAITGLLERESESFLPLSDFADGIERDRSRIATAAEYKGTFFRRLDLAGNLRRDDNNAFADFTTWRTSASLRMPEIGLRPHASIGTGVKLPTMLELYGLLPGFFTPNPNLQPEESTGWDAGIELTLARGAFILDVTYFEADLTNRINGLAPGPAFTFTAVNLPGISQRDGVEVAARWQIMPSLLLSGAYTHLHAVDADGADELRKPRHSAKADLTYLIDGGRGSVTVGAHYNGLQDDQAFRILAYSFGSPVTAAERVTLDDYVLISAAATYKLQPGVEIYGRVENVFDANYQEIFGFNSAGVAAYGGVRLTFGGEGPSLLGAGNAGR